MSSANDQIQRLNRRHFLKLSTAIPAALAASSLAPAPAREADPSPEALAGSKSPPIGIELYGVRGELTKNLPNTLKTVARMGYQVVEFYSPYTGWKFPFAKDVRSQLDDLGLRCFSTHNGFESLLPGENMSHAIELNQILGAREIIMASAPRNTKTADDWLRLCTHLTDAVEELKGHGLTAGFHNHHVEWLPLEGGQRVMDIIAANTPKDFVLQFDIGTCLEAGADPIAWIRGNPGRIKSVHLKDWAPGAAADEKGYRVLFGEGVAPWKDLVSALETVGGVEFYLMEQEGSRFSEFETAERCLATWQKFRSEA